MLFLGFGPCAYILIYSREGGLTAVFFFFFCGEELGEEWDGAGSFLEV